MEAPGRALDDKAQSRWQQQLSWQELQSYSARRMRSLSVCEFIPNPAYDEEEFKALPKQKQISKRERMMKYLQGPDGQSLRREVVVLHNFEEGHPPEFYRFRLLEPIKRLQSSPGNVSVATLKH